MAVERFMIAPLDSGLVTETKPWLIQDDAFERLENAYLYYGRLRKRIGATVMNNGVPRDYAQLYSRLGMQVATTDPAGNAGFTIPGGPLYGAVGQIFGVGSPATNHEIFTVISAAAGAQPMLASEAGNGTFSITTGVTAINASVANAPVYWYPALPVMGLPQYQIGNINDWPTFGFDTHFGYIYEDNGNGARWEASGTLFGTPTGYAATGTDHDFVWALNYNNATVNDTILFTTNNVDRIAYFANGVGWNAVPYLPQYAANAAQTIATCLCMAYFKGRLILFNTLENQIAGPALRFSQRARWTPAAFNPLDLANAFNLNAQLGAGFDDAPTKEKIVSICPIKDRLIVFFEQTTMELVFTGNAADPFRWQLINAELGVEATMSPVLFDKAVIGVGNVGVHSCNGTNVERIDEKIRQTVFTVANANFGKQRVYGIRDYANELIYWSYPDQNAATWPNRILIHNYKRPSWAIFDDSVTAFGYFQNIAGVQWQNFNVQWQDAVIAWNAAEWNTEYTTIVAGNQEGFTFLMESGIAKNSIARSITNIDFTTPNAPVLEVIDHNFAAGEFILIDNVAGVNVADFNNQIFQIVNIVDGDHFTLARNDTVGQTYAGRGTITAVSRIDILTKQYNFFQQDGRNAYVSKVDFNVNKTVNGAITVDYFTSTSNLSLLDEGEITGSQLGTSVLETSPYTLYPLEATQSQLWHPLYFQADGEYIQFNIYLSDDQMYVNNIALSDFELNAFTIYAEPTSTRLQ